jgi:hypothetical protein
MIAATMVDTQVGQPSRLLMIVASSYRWTPAISTWATAKLIALTR